MSYRDENKRKQSSASEIFNTCHVVMQCETIANRVSFELIHLQGGVSETFQYMSCRDENTSEQNGASERFQYMSFHEQRVISVDVI